MEDIEIREMTVEKRIHMIKCDNCGKFLGESFEYDDGWYENLGEYKQSMFLNSSSEFGGWYHYRKNLCDDCKLKYDIKIAETLKKLGFT